MAVAWLKRLFGVTEEVVPVQEVSEPFDSGAKNSEDSVSPKTTPSPQMHSYLQEEYLAEFDRAFCLELFGPEQLYVNSSDAQRTSARQMAKKLLHSEVLSKQLPRKPSTLPSLMKLLKQNDLSYSQIAESLLKDPSLTSQVLRTANSPFFRLSKNTVESLEQAIFIMGVSGIKKVVSAAILLPVFKSEEKSNAFTEAVWTWALSSGNAVDALFELRGEAKGSAYLLGLLPALALLLICQDIDKLEEGRPAEHKLLPVQKLGIFKSVGWKYCIAVRKEWGLPEHFDDYLYGLNKSEEQSHSDALFVAIIVAQFALMDVTNGAPISLAQLSEITGSSLTENTQILNQLEGRIAEQL